MAGIKVKTQLVSQGEMKTEKLQWTVLALVLTQISTCLSTRLVRFKIVLRITICSVS